VGLGLAIVHSIIDEHGGRITVSSEMGNGTTFRIDLPIDGMR
jgi:signal transduction histidine kinase